MTPTKNFACEISVCRSTDGSYPSLLCPWKMQNFEKFRYYIQLINSFWCKMAIDAGELNLDLLFYPCDSTKGFRQTLIDL